MNPVLEVDRADPAVTRTVSDPTVDLADGQVRMRIDSFALTANNVTYAVVGDMLGYWNFFPTGDPAWGRVPAMGWGTVVESARDGVAEGSRYYGWYPMASELVVTATPVAGGLRDHGPHRADHAPIYRMFTATDHDPTYEAGDEAEARHALLRGLCMTGHLADGHLALTHGDVEQSIALSASSKTAIGYAFSAFRKGRSVVGVTSAANLDFVSSLDCYSRVVTYDGIDEIPVATSTVVDMAGNGAATAAVHARLGDAIGRSLTIGKSHHAAAPVRVPAGPQPEFFFAPTAAQALIEVHGAEAHTADSRTTLFAFVEHSRGWLRLDRRTGPDAVEATWAELHAGAVLPHVGLVARQ